MRKLAVMACVLFLTGCAGNHSCCATCGTIAAGLGIGALLGLGEDAIDNAIDPEPKNTSTEEGQRKHWEWEQRRQSDLGSAVDLN